jgi:hypothetical protein
MRGMKVTVDAAMRARDVSRPLADQEAAARDARPEPARAREEAAARGPGSQAQAPDGPAGIPGAASQGRRPHRRRRRR